LGLSVHPSPSSRRHLHSIHHMSIIHHAKRQLENFNRRAEYYPPWENFLWGERDRGWGSEALSRSQRQRGVRRGQAPLWPLSPSRTRGRPAYCSASFLRREIKHDPQSARSWQWRTGQGGGDIRAHRSSEWPSKERERESVCCCRNRSVLLWRESEWCQKEKTQTRQQHASPMWEKRRP
jgi:hypothetical protein